MSSLRALEQIREESSPIDDFNKVTFLSLSLYLNQLDNLTIRPQQYVMSRTPDHLSLFCIKRKSCDQIAISSVVGHLLSVVHRIPETLYFSLVSGDVWQGDFSTSLRTSLVSPTDVNAPPKPLSWMMDNQGGVPFRLTASWTHFYGPIMLEGCFLSAMNRSVHALSRYARQLEDVMRILVRDLFLDVAMVNSSNERQSNAVDVAEAVAGELEQRIRYTSEVDKSGTQFRVRQLMDAASCDENLASMDSFWQPWL